MHFKLTVLFYNTGVCPRRCDASIAIRGLARNVLFLRIMAIAYFKYTFERVYGEIDTGHILAFYFVPTLTYIFLLVEFNEEFY